MIEKTINYCWFGGKDKPKSVLRCISSWGKFFPGYQIIEWNESNFDIYSHPYCTEAYQKKKWAYVSDYARLYIIYNNGGIYFDTDVEVIKGYDDIVNQKYFLGMEENGRINTGVGFGAELHSKIVKAMLDEYIDIHFIKSDGTMNPLVCPVYNTKAIEKLGCVLSGDNIEFLGGRIYKEEYFSPIGLRSGVIKITDNTHSIHHFDNTWMTTRQKLHKVIYQKYGETIIFPAIKLIKHVLHINRKIFK